MTFNPIKIEALRQELRKAVASEELLAKAESELEEVIASCDALDSSPVTSLRVSFMDESDEGEHFLTFDYSDASRIRDCVRQILHEAANRRRIEVLERTIQLQQKT